MLEIKNLHKYYKSHHVLKGIDLQVKKGQTVAIIGPSGSGKSTLLRCINLLETPDKGTIQLGETVVDAAHIHAKVKHEIRKKTGMVFQNYNLFANKTALENVTEALIVVQKIPKKTAVEQAQVVLHKVGLSDRSNYYPKGLSGGQQQRVGIARALALNPEIILFDEPTSALDPELVQEVLRVIKSVAADDVTMLIVTHELEFAREVADVVVFMDDGKIIEQNTAEEFFRNPVQERSQKYLEKFMQTSMFYI